MKECLDLIAQASCTDAAVLITGETGTGKELFAKAVHENSSSSKKHFVVVDCTAIPETLVESLLFGYKKGAFTGADKDTEGLIKQANGGTLFLDEIGELPPKFQKVFLRVLQERRFRPLGSQDEEESNFRLVAATNRDLEKMAKHGEFRKDLLFRLKSIVMTIPPLRQRGDDTREIVQHYVTKFCDRNSIGVKGFSPDFFEALSSYHWPGNVRELINAMEWTISVALNANVLNPKHLPEDIRIHMARSSIKGSTLHSGEHGKTMRYTKAFPKLHDARESAVLEAEKKYLNDLIQIADGDIKEACQLSGLERTQVYTLLKKHGLSLRN
jgi:two-component system NtrC family response regulator